MSFTDFVGRARRKGQLIVQPRMGMSGPVEMRAGLEQVRGARALTVGTLTIDSYTRVGDLEAAAAALASGRPLNGYPIATYAPEVTAHVLDGVQDECFPVQVRHGSGQPQHIVRAMARAGLSVTEGGPVSYCLPYGRVPLRTAVEAWRESCDLLLELTADPHIESFGGCMLGQLCPPSMLVAISVLEACFFAQRGLRSVSVSYAQQVHQDQDVEAILALRALCEELLDIDWHVVVYTYMGVYPTSSEGALDLLEQSVDLTRRTGSERLIVKTLAESRRIPTVAENVFALEHAAQRAARQVTVPETLDAASPLLTEARILVMSVLSCHHDVGEAILMAFDRGLLDIPFCLHPDNPGRVRSVIDGRGHLVWSSLGGLPLRGVVPEVESATMTAEGLLHALSYRQRKHDQLGGSCSLALRA